MTPSLAVVWITIFFIGASIGSFLNVCISRWPAGLSVVKPRSRCPKCERSITWSENIPVLSWLILRGKCRGCAKGISIQYPAVELTVGLIAVWSVVAYGPGFTAVRLTIGGAILLGIMLTDLLHYVIPDGFTVTGFIFALIASIVGLYLGEQGPFVGPWEAFTGACAAAGAIAIVGWLGEVALGKEAMGQGDVTLMAMIGAMLGTERSFLTIFVAAALGVVVFTLIVAPVSSLRARRAGRDFELPLVPFGVFLAPAGALTLLWGDQLINWYIGRLFG